MSPTVVLLHGCDHPLYFSRPAPLLGEEVWCYRCMKMRAVRETVAEMNAKCVSCRWSKSYGTARLMAETGAVNHAIRKSHSVKLRNGKRVIRIIGEVHAQQLALDMSEEATSVPPY